MIKEEAFYEMRKVDKINRKEEYTKLVRDA